MSSLTNEQLNSVIAQLDQAIYSHDQWYKNLQRVLISHVPHDDTDLMPDAHQLCRFGKWYQSSQAQFIQEHPTFMSLGDAHEQMHRGARRLIELVSSGLAIPVEEWDHFAISLDRMRSEFQALRHEFAEMAQNRDPLTEAQTRAGLLHDLQEQHALVQRGKQTCALAMLDLDHFKWINDEYGHAAGDAVLISTVKCIKSHMRSYDRIYRYGGEEFLICMPSTTVEEAREVVERIRTNISYQQFEFGDHQVTASFGITVLRKSQTVEESINNADKAMYKAKNTGRNRLVFDAWYQA